MTEKNLLFLIHKKKKRKKEKKKLMNETLKLKNFI